MTQTQAWIEAIRLRTLSAAFVPVAIGSALAWKDGLFHTTATIIAFLCAFLIQIGTNLANDYYDFKNGADTSDRVGFVRASASGIIKPSHIATAMFTVMALAFLSGLYLVWLAGWPVLVIGLLSILFGILYTGGPYPLAYNGLGDLFVFIFFGVIAVIGTYYVNTLQWSSESFWASLPAGALAVNILIVNNLRDIHTDERSNKRTLGVIFGETFLKVEYIIMTLLAYAIPTHLWFWNSYSLTLFLPYLALPLSVTLIIKIVVIEEKEALNAILGKTAMLLFLFGLLFVIGILTN